MSHFAERCAWFKGCFPHSPFVCTPLCNKGHKENWNQRKDQSSNRERGGSLFCYCTQSVRQSRALFFPFRKISKLNRARSNGPLFPDRSSLAVCLRTTTNAHFRRFRSRQGKITVISKLIVIVAAAAAGGTNTETKCFIFREEKWRK